MSVHRGKADFAFERVEVRKGPEPDIYPDGCLGDIRLHQQVCLSVMQPQVCLQQRGND